MDDTRTTAAVEALRAQLGSAVQGLVEFRGETTVVIDRAQWAEAPRVLRDLPAPGFDLLVEYTASDRWPVEPRFGVVVRLYCMQANAWIGLQSWVAGEDAVLPTLEGVFPNANWYERELFDLFGIRFQGHSDLRRILMPDDWQGHPLRKDHPLGYEEVQFSFNAKEIDQRKPYATS